MGLVDIVIIMLVFYSIGFILHANEINKELQEIVIQHNELNKNLNFQGKSVEEHDSLNYIDSAMFLSMYDE